MCHLIINPLFKDYECTQCKISSFSPDSFASLCFLCMQSSFKLCSCNSSLHVTFIFLFSIVHFFYVFIACKPPSSFGHVVFSCFLFSFFLFQLRYSFFFFFVSKSRALVMQLLLAPNFHFFFIVKLLYVFLCPKLL